MLDVTTLNFIYYKMKSRESSDTAKEFFALLWKNLKREKMKQAIIKDVEKYGKVRTHNIPHLNVFKAHLTNSAINYVKFYQMKFLELVLKVKTPL